MNLMFCGIIDIIIVVFFLGAIFYGYKKGFMERFVKLANGLCGLLISILFCNDLTNFLINNNIFYGTMKENVLNNISQMPVFQEIPEGGYTTRNVLKQMGMPEIFSSFIPETVLVDATEAIEQISEGLTRAAMVVISFLILFIGFTLLCFLLKILIKILRKATLIRIMDGILGVLFYGILAVLVIYGSLYLISYLITLPSFAEFRDFVIIDLQLDTDAFRLSKTLYDNNLIANLVKAFI